MHLVCMTTNDRFCGRCNTEYALMLLSLEWDDPVAEQRVQRRLAAILAADVAGYSRLMGLDEVGTLAALKALRREIVDPAIAERNGTAIPRVLSTR